MDALRDDGPKANPPQNMKKSLIFLGVIVMVLCFLPVFGLEAKQVRREADTRKLAARERMRGRADSGTDVLTTREPGEDANGVRSRGSSTVPMQGIPSP